MINEVATIQLKLTKAKTLLSEVSVLISNKFYTTSVNRLYYSCFHATTALLLTQGLTFKNS